MRTKGGGTPVFISEGAKRKLGTNGSSLEQLSRLRLLCREDLFGVWWYLDGEDDTYGQWYPLLSEE